MFDEPAPLAPTGVEVWFAVAAAVAVVFAGFAIWKLVRHEWSVGFALTLVLLTFVVPFAGPVVLLARWLWRRAR
ncbi:hypothetical protein ASG49_05280 [Marmoricola sp. Leaf446]|uniref:hypothetical protein n=1 Tax=Marmoricola sp. Leaf446 TaxID=1736379 RepID=UPI0006FC3233|nr:hypothetical protein [Marmoricola sp. Leaf446]KQT94304.1 hypothetical protein ASG49_05280 [Marmoricola sp. Leaf446]